MRSMPPIKLVLFSIARGAFKPVQRGGYGYGGVEKQKKTKILHSEIPPPKVPFRAAQCLQRTLMPLLV